MTRGLKSSEFIICIIATILGVGMALYGIKSAEILAALSIAGAFITGRSAVKSFKGEKE